MLHSLTRAAAAAAAWAAALALAPGASAQTGSLEYAVKATYLYKLAPFIEWPAGAFESPTSPFVICVAGDDPFGDLLETAVRGEEVAGRPIVLGRMPAVEGEPACHVLYVSGSANQSVAEGLAAVAGVPVLTVTDGARDRQAKGIVHFVIRANRVRFEIDEQAAYESGLVISSKVLSLAVSVKRREPS